MYMLRTSPQMSTCFAGSCLDITLHKRDPMHMALEWPGISKGDYFSTNIPAGANGMKSDLIFTIEAVGLNYESTVLSAGSKIANDLQKGLLQLYFDIPKISYSALLAGQQRLNIPIFVPAGSKCVYIGFMYGFQLWPSTASKKNLSGRTIFPNSLINASFSLSGHENVGFRRGLEGLGSGFSSESCRAYFADLRNRGIIDWDFEEMFPKSPADRSYIQVIFLDLRPYRISKNTTLYAELEFGAALSPEQMYLVSVFVQELALYRARGAWHTKIQDG